GALRAYPCRKRHLHSTKKNGEHDGPRQRNQEGAQDKIRKVYAHEYEGVENRLPKRFVANLSHDVRSQTAQVSPRAVLSYSRVGTSLSSSISRSHSVCR